MMKYTVAIMFAITGLVLPYTIFAQETMYESEIFVEDFNVKDAMYNIENLQESVDDITTELFELDEKERSKEGVISDKYRETRDEIVNVINTINATTEKVGNMLRKISVYKKQIFLKTKELREIREEIDETKEYMGTFTNFMYKLNNKLYGPNDDTIDDVKLLIESDNIPRTLANDYVVTTMLKQFHTLMDELTDTEQKQIALIRRLNTLKVAAQADITDYHSELEKLQQKKNYLIKFIELYKNDSFRADGKMQNLFDSRKDVHHLILSFIDDITQKNYTVPFDVEEKFTELETAKEEQTIEDDHPIARPIYPVDNIQTLFNDKNFERQYGVPHLGIQITAEQGSPVFAARDGVVYHVTNHDGIGINRIMVLHDKGYVSTYMYMSDVAIEEGDIVRRGQLLGYSGGEPGTKGAGFISNGPNLTFGIFKDGIPTDPITILDLSIVKDKDVLPDVHHIKYLRDKYARPIDITNVTFMTGDNPLVRADAFLNLYGVGLYKQLAFREDAIDGTNIDRDVVICIAFAESTLGKYLTTDNNIGNVGNNDRGERIGFGSAFAGARAIAQTLNNRYLGHYHTIKQLSRYGNKDGKIYASSPINRQRNVLKCLSQIKGYYVPEDYPFRTGLNPNEDLVTEVDFADDEENTEE